VEKVPFIIIAPDNAPCEPADICKFGEGVVSLLQCHVTLPTSYPSETMFGLVKEHDAKQQRILAPN
jgi:hypothetical protein